MRSDILLYNESNALVIAAADLAGLPRCDPAAGDQAFGQWVSSGAFLPVELAQDDPQVIRVVVDEPLSQEEEQQWVARVETCLNLNCGELVVAGGTDFVDDADQSWIEGNGALFRTSIEPGWYHVRVDTQLPGTNGLRAAGFRRGEATAYWSRTRPGQDIPGWLRYLDDPSFSWGEAASPTLVGFVIHLQRASDTGLRPELVGGYPPIDAGRRIPAVCPAGLPAHPAAVERVVIEDASQASVRLPLAPEPDSETVLVGKSGTYSLAPQPLPPALRPLAGRLDEEMALAGYRLAAELCNDRLAGAILRVFSGPEHDRYAVMMLGIFGDMGTTVYSRFADGRWLSTANQGAAHDEPERGVFRQVGAGMAAADLDKLHVERQKVLAGEHGGPSRLGTTPLSLAESIDEFAAIAIG